MKPRVLPRVLAALCAAFLCSGLGPIASAQPRVVEKSARPDASAAPGEPDGPRWRHRHVRLGEGSPMLAISDEAYVPQGVVHHDDIVCIMGKVRIEGEVTGDVVVIMGTAEISGKVHGDFVGVMTPTHLADTADIGGDLVSIGGPLERAPGSTIGGEQVKLNFMRHMPFAHGGLRGLFVFLFILKLISLALLFVAILLITALVPRRVSIIASVFPARWGMAILVGLLGYCATAIASFVLICTIIGIPLVPALLFAAKVVKWLGLAAIFYLIGDTIGRNVLKRELSHFAAVMGGFAIYAVISLVPVFGAVFSTVVGVLGFGIAVLTRFGTEEGWRRPGVPSMAQPPGSASGPPPVYATTPGGGV